MMRSFLRPTTCRLPRSSKRPRSPLMNHPCALNEASVARWLPKSRSSSSASRPPISPISPGATGASFNAHGGFMSGDLGRFDERGNLHVVGRKKDLIIRGGHNIYPARIEDLAHRHPGVSKAVCFPIADERLGEQVCLAIIARTQPGPSAEEMLAHLDAAGLSKYDMPEFY